MTSALRNLALVLVLTATSTGCTSLATDFCALQCDCEGCSDNQREECAIEEGARVDQADVYGCADLHDEYLQCVVDHPLCESADFRDPDICNDARERRNSCEDGRGIRIDLRAP
jgi:hypothetical protein